MTGALGLADRLVFVEPGKCTSQVERRRVWVQGVRIDFHFGPELVSTGNLDQDRVLNHNGTVARVGGAGFAVVSRTSCLFGWVSGVLDNGCPSRTSGPRGALARVDGSSYQASARAQRGEPVPSPARSISGIPGPSHLRGSSGSATCGGFHPVCTRRDNRSSGAVERPCATRDDTGPPSIDRRSMKSIFNPATPHFSNIGNASSMCRNSSRRKRRRTARTGAVCWTRSRRESMA
jgi:hypothetical protein